MKRKPLFGWPRVHKMLRMRVNHLNYHESKKHIRSIKTKLWKNWNQLINVSAVTTIYTQLFNPADVTPREANQKTHRLDMNLKRQIAARWLVLLYTPCPCHLRQGAQRFETRKIKITYKCSNFLAFCLNFASVLVDGFFLSIVIDRPAY